MSLLLGMGHQVEAYEQTNGIIEKLETGKYTSVFLDIVLPEKDGYKFLRELRLYHLQPISTLSFVLVK